MSRMWEIARREFLENVRTKAFLVGLVLTPIWMGLVFFVPSLVRDTKVEDKPVVILDTTGELADKVVARIRDAGGFAPEIDHTPNPFEKGLDGLSRVDELRLRAGASELFAVVLTPAGLEKRFGGERGEPASEVLGASRSADDAYRGPALAAIVNRVIDDHIAARLSIPPQHIELLQKPGIAYQPVGAGGESTPPAIAIIPLMFMMLLFMGIMGSSQMLVLNTLEEKTNRVYELLLSSVNSRQLMTGKILGICAVGFTLMLVWSGGGLLAASMRGFSGLVTGQQALLFVAYYVLGFLMIASLMVAIGSACNTLKEAQNLMAPLSIVVALPLIVSFVVMRNPNGEMSTILSFVPIFTPFLMMARLAGVPPPPDWQIPASLLLLVLSTWIAMRLAARIFRTGILLYGQPPSLREMWRWLRSSD